MSWNTEANDDLVSQVVEVHCAFTCYDSCITCDPSHFASLGQARFRHNLTSSDSQLTFSVRIGDKEVTSYPRSIGE